MPWVRFDDHFAIHRKVAGLSDAAFRLHVSAIFWCALNLTDGWVPEEDLDDVSARVRTPARFAAECVSRGAWHEARHDCGSEKCAAPVDADGWVIHDYLQYQPSKKQVMDDREKAAERQRKWREAKSGSGKGKSGRNGMTDDRNAVTDPSLSENDPIHNGSSNAVTNGSSKSSPTRPAPKEAGRSETAPERPDGRANPPGSPSGRRQDSKPAAEAIRIGLPDGYRPVSPQETQRRAAALIQSLQAHNARRTGDDP
jgi:hypothetical protein